MIRCCFIVGAMAGFPARAPAALLACAAWAGALLGCSREPVVVPAASLTFPVVLITGGAAASNALPHRARVFASLDQLSHMRVELYSVTSSKTSAEAPKVIDANAQVLDMMNIEGEHGGLWIMANPTGMMPIRFTLVRREQTGIGPARDLIAAAEFLGHDLDSERKELRSERIRKATSMAEVMQIIDEMPPPQ